MSAIRAGTLAFLAAQHGGIDLDGTRVGFVPLGMTAIVAIIVWRASCVLADVLERLRMTSRRDLAEAGTVQAGSYAATCAALAVLARLGTTSVPPIPVAVGATMLCGIITAASLAWTSIRRRWSALSAPDYIRPGLRAAMGALCVYVGAGALLVAASLLAHAGQVSQLSRMVGGGVSGIPLLVVGVLCAPNAVIAAASFLAGPGFAVGTGTSVTAFSASRGTLPAFPILGAIPSGRIPSVLAVLLLGSTLLAAGWVTARLAQGPAAVDFGTLLSRIAVAAAGAGAAMAALGWLCRGRPRACSAARGGTLAVAAGYRGRRRDRRHGANPDRWFSLVGMALGSRGHTGHGKPAHPGQCLAAPRGRQARRAGRG